MEEPERRVGGVIEAGLLPFGEHVGDQPVLDVLRKRAQNPARFRDAAGCQREALQADHGVAAPVGKPVVTRDHGAKFLARGVGARGVLGAARGQNQKLIGRQRQFRAEASRTVGCALASSVSRRPCSASKAASGRGSASNFPRFGGGDELQLLAGPKVEAKITGAPHGALRFVAARLLGTKENVVDDFPVGGKRHCGRTNHPQRRAVSSARANLIAFFRHRHRVLLCQRSTHMSVV